MAARHREEELESFRSDPAKTVCLVSLRAGAYGLNLTCASQCVILDPFWNPFVEMQGNVAVNVVNISNRPDPPNWSGQTSCGPQDCH
jgi:hypothetical protein